MASIKVKFKPSTVADHEGTIFYQILHERKQRQLFSDYHVFPTEWDENRSMVTTTQKRYKLGTLREPEHGDGKVEQLCDRSSMKRKGASEKLRKTLSKR